MISQRAAIVVLMVGIIPGLTLLAGCRDRDTGGAARDLPTLTSTEQTSMPTESIRVHVFNEAGELVPVETSPIVKTDDEWREILSEEQFRILRSSGTERPFCGALLDNKTEGVYTCAACGLPLFSSSAKFESGSGWPSFFKPIAEGNVAERVDRSHGMIRTEINCARCDGHLGHVFDDGPRPTGLRFCLNSESLAFTPLDEVASLADPAAAKKNADESKDPINADGQRAAVVLAGGCFWCVEAVFEELDGVIEAVSGYAGGSKETANYKEVAAGKTKHAEAVRIIFDPNKISYEELLQIHFATHDPTQLNRQGNDIGPQYRSAIFYANEREKALAEAIIEDLTDAKAFSRPIVTTLEPLTEFYVAEAYHQNYVCENPMQGYVRGVALPKVEKVRKLFKDKLKDVSPLDQTAR